MYYRYCPTVKSLLNVPLNHKSHLRFLSDAKCPFEIQNLLNVKKFLSPTEKHFGQKRKRKRNAELSQICGERSCWKMNSQNGIWKKTILQVGKKALRINLGLYRSGRDSDWEKPHLEIEWINLTHSWTECRTNLNWPFAWPNPQKKIDRILPNLPDLCKCKFLVN